MKQVGDSNHRDSDRLDADRDRKKQWSRRLIRLSTFISILSAIALVGGFIYGTFGALGSSLGQSLQGNSTSAGGTGAGNHALGTANSTSGKAQSPQSVPGNGTTSNPSSTAGSPSLTGKTIHLVALGDSLTHGFGDASGQGYVGDVSQMFRQHGTKVIQSNLGVNGLTSSGLLTELQQASVQNLLQSADLILISIGGNDLNNAAGLPNIQVKRIARAETQFSTNLTSIFKDIRKFNSKAPIVLIGLYNPYGNVAASAGQTDSIVEGWDLQEDTIAAAFPNTVVVQTFDLFQLHPNKFLYLDHFHPNQAGYQRIAERIWQDLQS